MMLEFFAVLRGRATNFKNQKPNKIKILIGLELSLGFHGFTCFFLILPEQWGSFPKSAVEQDAILCESIT